MRLEQMVRRVFPNLTPYNCGLPDLPVEEIKKVLGKETVMKLSFNENPLGPSPKALEAMRREVEKLQFYPDSDGEPLRARIAEIDGISPEQVILSNGGDEAIQMIAQTFLEPGDEAIIPKITFSSYLSAAHLMGATPVITPMKQDFSIDLAAILDSVTDKTKIIFLCNPNNPTGKVIPRDEMAAFLEQVPSSVLVAIDEAYHDYAVSPEYRTAVEFIADHKPVLVVRTFSKIHSLASARIGYAMGSAKLIEALRHVRLPFNVNGIAQAGALASLDDEEHAARSKQINEAGKQLMYEAFQELGLTYLESNGNFVYVDTGRDNQEMFDRLAKEYGIIVRPLTGYGLTTSLRISVGKEEEVKTFVQALKQIL
ncbi:histidinol-phosphate transaminase [Brevibacillus massiliensis]|uniref:histidinol-phosphate transaminase n=1 Tax=Brevibacillus massiliensis TaxID=1118054 RepID=UPI0002E35B73|nr:histidinol-phosphate transaminase [Brevibacillus massiliensis]